MWPVPLVLQTLDFAMQIFTVQQKWDLKGQRVFWFCYDYDYDYFKQTTSDIAQPPKVGIGQGTTQCHILKKSMNLLTAPPEG